MTHSEKKTFESRNVIFEGDVSISYGTLPIDQTPACAKQVGQGLLSFYSFARCDHRRGYWQSDVYAYSRNLYNLLSILNGKTNRIIT